MFFILWTYLCLAVFAIAAGIRVFKYVSLPPHLRWELYPVKHEAGKKADYGGSYLEESDWWEKKRESSLYNEMKFMIPEILFVKGLYEENRKLWYVSFPFHFGLYLLLGTFGLLVLSAVLMLFGLTIGSGSGFIGAAIYYVTILLGFGGLLLGTIGSLGLLYRRLTDNDLKAYTSFIDYLNLFMFVVFFVVALLTWLFIDPHFEAARAFIYSLFTLGSYPAGYNGSASVLGSVTVVLAAFLAGYIPLTHMSHMFMKYFMYHDIRWGDEPNIKGSKLETKVIKNLGFKPTWSAPHIKADGSSTWTDIALTNPAKLEEDK